VFEQYFKDCFEFSGCFETEFKSRKARRIDHTNIMLQNRKEIEHQIGVSSLYPTELQIDQAGSTRFMYVSHTVQLQNTGFSSFDPHLVSCGPYPNEQGSEQMLSPSIGTPMDFCNAIEQNGMRKKNRSGRPRP
jgi:hypothetical protein